MPGEQAIELMLRLTRDCAPQHRRGEARAFGVFVTGGVGGAGAGL